MCLEYRTFATKHLKIGSSAFSKILAQIVMQLAAVAKLALLGRKFVAEGAGVTQSLGIVRMTEVSLLIGAALPLVLFAAAGLAAISRVGGLGLGSIIVYFYVPLVDPTWPRYNVSVRTVSACLNS